MSDGVTVETVLDSPRATMPPKALEEARNQPGRREQIEGITKQIESQGIKYVFFQQVSITGRIMGKGVVASFFPQVAESGYRLTVRFGSHTGSSRSERTPDRRRT
jgi:hypothetical protein